MVGYALSPIDLIPDFIPVLGYLDDLIILPLGINLALKMIPLPVMEQCRARARESLSHDSPKNWLGAGIVIGIWLLLIVLIIVIVVRII